MADFIDFDGRSRSNRKAEGTRRLLPSVFSFVVPNIYVGGIVLVSFSASFSLGCDFLTHVLERYHTTHTVQFRFSSWSECDTRFEPAVRSSAA